jgi:hypothetical protein
MRLEPRLLTRVACICADSYGSHVSGCDNPNLSRQQLPQPMLTALDLRELGSNGRSSHWLVTKRSLDLRPRLSLQSSAGCWQSLACRKFSRALFLPGPDNHIDMAGVFSKASRKTRMCPSVSCPAANAQPHPPQHASTRQSGRACGKRIYPCQWMLSCPTARAKVGVDAPSEAVEQIDQHSFVNAPWTNLPTL